MCPSFEDLPAVTSKSSCGQCRRSHVDLAIAKDLEVQVHQQIGLGVWNNVICMCLYLPIYTSVYLSIYLASPLLSVTRCASNPSMCYHRCYGTARPLVEKANLTEGMGGRSKKENDEGCKVGPKTAKAEHKQTAGKKPITAGIMKQDVSSLLIHSTWQLDMHAGI
jgi:hypothetical protein